MHTQNVGKVIEAVESGPGADNTIIVLWSDHGYHLGEKNTFQKHSLWERSSHVPLVFIWPGRIAGGRRVAEPVSMIDVLPTLLELAGLPRAQVAQGHSLAPLLLGQDGWQPRPVIFDEFRATEDGSLVGNLEILDGRWGRSLEIRTADGLPAPTSGRHPAPADRARRDR